MTDDRLNLAKTPPPEEERALLAEPIRGAHYPYDYGVDDAGRLQFAELWRKARKHQWLILFIAAIITTVVTVEVFRTKSLYQATTTIEIEAENRTLFRSGDVVIESEESDSGYYVAMAMKTKIRLLQSRPLLEDVVVNLKLDQDPNFLDVTERKSIWEALKSIGSKLGKSAPRQTTANTLDQAPPLLPPNGQLLRPAEESARLAPFVDVLSAHLMAAPIEETRMLAISFQHTQPAMAAVIANTTAEVFIERSFRSKTQKSTSTSSWLAARTRELKAKVEQAEAKLADYTARNNIFSTDGKENLTTDNLSRLHEQATRAETDRLLKQSLYEEVKQGRAAQLPEAFADPKTAALQTRLGELQTTAAQYRGRYGPDNPRTTDLNKQITAIEQQIDDSRKQLEEKLKADYERVTRDAHALQAALDRAKAEAVRQNQAVIQLSIIRQEVETAKSLYTDFLQKTNQANLQTAEQHKNMQVIDPASVPARPVSPNRPRTILIGFLLSLCLGVLLALALEYFDDTIKTVDDIGRYMNLPALAVIPTVAAAHSRLLPVQRAGESHALTVKAGGATVVKIHSPVTQQMLNNNRSLLAEAYRGLRTSVLLSTAGQPPKTILFTSSHPGEGKTTTTVNTGISLAQLGASVLLIDADLRRPAVHKLFGADHTRGLATYLSREIAVDELIQKSELPNLSLLPCGPLPPNPAELISSERMKELLRTLSARYDHILIDSPPLINVTDPLILSTLVQGVILVVQSGRSKRAIVARARRELTNVGAKIFGVVLNNVDLKREGYDGYYYARYHSDYSQKRTGSLGD